MTISRISDTISDLVENLLPTIAMKAGLGLDVEYDLMLNIYETPLGNQPCVMVMFTVPSPIVGQPRLAAYTNPLPVPMALQAPLLADNLGALAVEVANAISEMRQMPPENGQAPSGLIVP